MLEEGQTWTHPDGRTLTIVMRLDPQAAIGEVWLTSLAFGPMSASMSATEQGVAEAGFTLDDSNV